MKTCKDMEPLILNYVSGDILNSQRKILDKHLEECDACLNEIMKLQSVDLSLTELRDAEEDPPNELKGAILNKIRSEKKSVRSERRFLSPTGILAAVSISLAALVFVLAAKIESISIYGNEPKERVVKILFFSNEARNVSLVGDFNGWGSSPVALKQAKNGEWTADLKLKPGMYQYNFIVDGDKWVADPNSKSQVPDGFGGVNSVVIVDGDKGNEEKKIESSGAKI